MMKSANPTCSYSTITFIACTQRLLYSYPYTTAASCVPHEVNPDLVTWHLVNSHAHEIGLAQVDLETLHGLVCLPTCTVQSCLSRPEQPHHGLFPMEAVLSDTHRKAMFAVPTLGALQIILLLFQYSFHVVPVSSLVMNECLKCAMSTWGSSKKAILSAFARCLHNSVLISAQLRKSLSSLDQHLIMHWRWVGRARWCTGGEIRRFAEHIKVLRLQPIQLT